MGASATRWHRASFLPGSRARGSPARPPCAQTPTHTQGDPQSSLPPSYVPHTARPPKSTPRSATPKVRPPHTEVASERRTHPCGPSPGSPRGSPRPARAPAGPTATAHSPGVGGTVPSRASSSSTRAAQRAMVRREPHGERPWSGARTAAAGGTPPRAGPAVEPGEGAARSPRPGPRALPARGPPSPGAGEGRGLRLLRRAGIGSGRSPPASCLYPGPPGRPLWVAEGSPPRFLSRVPGAPRMQQPARSGVSQSAAAGSRAQAAIQTRVPSRVKAAGARGGGGGGRCPWRPSPATAAMRVLFPVPGHPCSLNARPGGFIYVCPHGGILKTSLIQ